ncbi:hypothetical protein [Amycolatopsis methanolica]|uniref:Uncharacterized protein n=1 Tax=Amycolatopsis methanolica 239 TaxID=1068978 RepID=A0A076MNR2_AMYME|nr:hypothetical protein [Amycolatopsis methanolica]AIJ22264.1 hypothetical protein AMETH_2172 [Amycolatopsis methanolica 239]
MPAQAAPVGIALSPDGEDLADHGRVRRKRAVLPVMRAAGDLPR